MSEEKERPRRESKLDSEQVKDILGAVSQEVPTLIRSIIGSVFSEEAGKSMGKAAGAFYKELKDSGIPEPVAVKMTENYVSVFTNLGELMKGFGRGGRKGGDIGEQISERIKDRVQEKQRHEEDEEDDEDED
jgi:hypothetical protein